jgi:PAS domain S-box-containing protein
MENSNHFLAGVFQALPDPIVMLDKENRIVTANRSFCNLVRLKEVEPIGKTLNQLFSSKICKVFNKAAEKGLSGEILIKNHEGVEIPYQITLLNDQLAGGEKVTYVLKDITGVRQVEVSLIESESLYKTLVNQLPNPIVIHINGMVVFANDLIVEVTGLTRDEIIGKNIAELMTDPHGPSSKMDFGSLMWDSFMEEEEFEIRTENRKVVIKNFLMRNSRIKYKGQNAVMTILIDITERRHLEKYILRRIIETEEKDRKQFAADLHDDLGPTLSSIKLQLGLLQNSTDPDKFAKAWQICNDQLLEAISRMRVIANNLTPRLIENFGLEAALSSFIQTMQREGVFTIDFSSNLNGMRFSKYTELHFYRIICELINNTVKHAGATKASLQIHAENGELIVEYTDNGKGYDIKEINKKEHGMGVSNIIQRINLIDARIQFSQKETQMVVKIWKEL